ncbi:hypothetical protein I6E78_18440, partial [Pseudoalteromonas sp. NZS127]|nr:hypothetical protein [Pseudoalteromonas sp. NZS127]
TQQHGGQYPRCHPPGPAERQAAEQVARPRFLQGSTQGGCQEGGEAWMTPT